MKYGPNGGLVVQRTDQCAKCLYWNPDPVCALIEALTEQAVILNSEEMKVQNCGQFEPILPNPLKLVKGS